MNVDNDLDQHLLNQFSCLGTTEKDDLVKQLRELLAGCDLNETTATFFLDMNNWNLQAAVCSYIDYSNNDVTPSMMILDDCTIGGNAEVPPNTVFRKTWRIKNSGHDAWPSGTSLQFVSGFQMGEWTNVAVPALKPYDVTEVTVQFTSPSIAGAYFNTWKLMTTKGIYFGESIVFAVNVSESGTLALTQQLHQLST